MGGSAAAMTQTKLGIFARRPAVGAAVSLMVGIGLHRTLPDRPEIWLAMAGAGAVAAVGAGRLGGVANVLLTMAVALLGVSAGQLERYHFAANDIIAYTTD
jgi:hypothetical protein